MENDPTSFSKLSRAQLIAECLHVHRWLQHHPRSGKGRSWTRKYAELLRAELGRRGEAAEKELNEAEE